MFGFLGFILIFILLIVLIGITFVGNIIRMIFGLGRRAPKRYSDASGQNTSSTDYSQASTASSSSSGKRKIFADDEGEYVEFEEVK